jgi:hypothetical protein
MAVGLLHDTAMDQVDHARRGRRIVRLPDMKLLQDVIASHMEIRLHLVNTNNRACIVCLADKLVSGSRVVSLKERFYQALKIWRGYRGRGKGPDVIRENLRYKAAPR